MVFRSATFKDGGWGLPAPPGKLFAESERLRLHLVNILNNKFGHSGWSSPELFGRGLSSGTMASGGGKRLGGLLHLQGNQRLLLLLEVVGILLVGLDLGFEPEQAGTSGGSLSLLEFDELLRTLLHCHESLFSLLSLLRRGAFGALDEPANALFEELKDRRRFLALSACLHGERLSR